MARQTETEDRPLSEADARMLRFLRGLVLVLTTTMIAGMALLIVLFAMRFSGRDEVAPQPLGLPDGFVLPDASRPTAVTRTGEQWIVVTEAGDVLFYDAAGGEPVRHIPPGD